MTDSYQPHHAGTGKQTSSTPVVLFYTDNGLGLGHLTRQAAVALRAGGSFQPFFLTMSAGYTLLADLGIPGEHFPSYGRLGVTKAEWEPIMARRLLEAIDLTGASVVVVDHVSPPRVFESIRSEADDVVFVWSRRGLWQRGKNRAALQLADNFDLVVEPGDVASPIDQGPTVEARKDTTSIGPVVMIDEDEFLNRDEARAQLGIPSEGRSVLINLGDADPAEVGRLIEHTRKVISEVATDQVITFAPLHPLHGGRIPKPDGVIMAPVYPVARCFNAFDGVVSTAGYNSFHEIVASGLPAVFVPHRGASIDDQQKRAEFGALAGRAQWAPDVLDDSFVKAVEKMLRPDEPAIARETTAALGRMDGARQFASLLADLAKPQHQPGSLADRELTEHPQLSKAALRPTLVDAANWTDEQVKLLASSMVTEDRDRTIVLVRDGDPGPLWNEGLAFESLMTEREWATLAGSSYSRYRERRVAGITERFGVRHIIDHPSTSADPPR